MARLCFHWCTRADLYAYPALERSFTICRRNHSIQRAQFQTSRQFSKRWVIGSKGRLSFWPGVLQEQGQFYDFADIDQAVADCESAKTIKPILRLE